MLDFSVRILTIGHTLLTRWTPMPVRPHWRLYWNPTPGACVRFGRSVYRLDAGMMLLMPPRTAFVQTLEAPFETLYIHFMLGSPADRLHGRAYPLRVTPSRRANLVTLQKRLVAGPGAEDPGWLAIAVVAEALSCVPGPDWPRRMADPRIDSVVTAIEARPEKPWCGQDFAELAHLSVNGMTRLFRTCMGTTPQRYLTEQRLARAAAMLRETAHSIERIAAACGFTERGYFTRMFSARFRMGPAAWRRQAMEP